MSPAPTATPPRDDAAAASALAAFLRLNYGTPPAVAPWYPLIQGVAVAGDTATVRTSSAVTYEGRRLLSGLCPVVEDYMRDHPELRLKRVNILGQGDVHMLSALRPEGDIRRLPCFVPYATL